MGESRAVMHAPATIAMWLQRILGHEGGFSRDPADPGNWTGGARGVGELRGTKWGIAANTYPDLDIPTLTPADAAAIYQRDYLVPLHADRYHDGVAFQLLDYAINSGPRAAVRGLQRAIGVRDDGDIGPVTMAALERWSESDLVMLVTAERIEFMTRLRNWPEHGRGWMRRLADNLRFGAEDS